MHVPIYTCMYMCVHICKSHVSIYTYIYVCVCVRVSVLTYEKFLEPMCMRVYIYICKLCLIYTQSRLSITPRTFFGANKSVD